MSPFKKFETQIKQHRQDIWRFFTLEASLNKLLVLGYGASTKGNVLLQYCGLTRKELPLIADVNKEKWGCYTPGTNILIVSEEIARSMEPDYFFVLPWHFKEHIIKREKKFLKQGGKLVFPLPHFEIIGGD